VLEESQCGKHIVDYEIVSKKRAMAKPTFIFNLRRLLILGCGLGVVSGLITW